MGFRVGSVVGPGLGDGVGDGVGNRVGSDEVGALDGMRDGAVVGVTVGGSVHPKHVNRHCCENSASVWHSPVPIVFCMQVLPALKDDDTIGSENSSHRCKGIVSNPPPVCVAVPVCWKLKALPPSCCADKIPLVDHVDPAGTLQVQSAEGCVCVIGASYSLHVPAAALNSMPKQLPGVPTFCPVQNDSHSATEATEYVTKLLLPPSSARQQPSAEGEC